MRIVALSLKKLTKTATILVSLTLAVAGFPPEMAFAAPGAPIFGKITAPAGVDKYNSKAGAAANNIGLMLFVSNMIKLSSIVAGIWVLTNFVSAGWIYITGSGDAGAHKKVSEKMTMSITGLMIIVGAYTIAALLGLIIFGDASYILNPTLKGI